MTVGTPLFFVNPKGVGYLDGAGDTPSSIFADSFIDNAGEYTFAGSSLTAGETSRRLFLTHEPVGDISLGQTVQFMISDGLNFDVQRDRGTGARNCSSRWIRASGHGRHRPFPLVTLGVDLHNQPNPSTPRPADYVAAFSSTSLSRER